MRSYRLMCAGWLVLMLLSMPGCVVWDIMNGIEASNANLERIQTQLDAIDRDMDRVNTNLEQVEARLNPMGETLASMDTQLKDLQTRLEKTNGHLESLRKTINNIDSTIPFLKLSGDDEEEQEALEKGDQPTNEAEKPENESAAETGNE